MHKYLSLILISLLSLTAQASFTDDFEDATLRADYIFSGTNVEQHVALHSLTVVPEWAGRRVNMDKLLLAGNAQITMTDSLTGRVLYRQSFSTLFQEWQHNEEATRLQRAFENTLLMPMPRRAAYVSLTLFNNRREATATLTHLVQPGDVLIRRGAKREADPHVHTIMQNGKPSECIDLVYISEGYTEEEMPLFFEDVRTAVDALFSHVPFNRFKERFNIIALALPSAKTDVSQPLMGTWHETPVRSHFSTLNSDRYLMTESIFHLHDLLEAIPTEHIIILANTKTYGGGGIYNMYMLTSARQQWFRPVVVHEFGHSFAGLADEYFYNDQYETFYPDGIEPWEPNLTTQVDFASKWQKLVSPASNGKPAVGLVEGGGYQSKGIWRGCENCRMRTNSHPDFCPVCQQAIEKVIDYQTRSWEGSK